MMKGAEKHVSLEKKILYRLRRWGRGCVFSNSDFFSLGADATVANSLYHLKEKGIIRPLLRGLYVYPKYSRLLGEYLATDMHHVAAALARKHKWKLQASGNTALNYWGLSTQIPTRLLYYSSGPHRKYMIGNRSLEFRHLSLKESAIDDAQCELFVQAVKELGNQCLNDHYLSKIKAIASPELQQKVRKALPLLTEKNRILHRKLLSKIQHESVSLQTGKTAN